MCAAFLFQANARLTAPPPHTSTPPPSPSGNHKFFLLFIFYVHLSSVYAIALIVTRFTQARWDSRPPLTPRTCPFSSFS